MFATNDDVKVYILSGDQHPGTDYKVCGTVKPEAVAEFMLDKAYPVPIT